MKTFLLIIFISFAGLVYSQETLLPLSYDLQEEMLSCSSFDLSDRFFNISRGDKERHQGNSGWCYAMVAADLVGFKLGQHISAASISINYINSVPKDFQYDENPSERQRTFPLGFGFMKEAIERSNESHFCLESEFPSEDYSFEVARNNPIAEIDFYRNLASRNSIPFNANGKAPYIPQCLTDQDLSFLIHIEDPIQIRKMIIKDDFKRVLRAVSSAVCTQTFNLPESSEVIRKFRVTDETNSEENQEFFNNLDELLNQEIPIGIALDNTIFNNPSINLESNPNRENHAVSIIGRRFNPEAGRCEYLIRDSDGDCSTYNQDYECNNKHAWLPRKLIKMGARYYTHIQDSSE